MLRRILLVDDEADLRHQLAWAVRSEDREIFEAANAVEALGLIQTLNFDVIITDLHMGDDRDGLSVLRNALEKDPLTQVLIVTSYGTPLISVEAMKSGAFDYLERNSPGINTLQMVRTKVRLALDFRDSKSRSSIGDR